MKDVPRKNSIQIGIRYVLPISKAGLINWKQRAKYSRRLVFVWKKGDTFDMPITMDSLHKVAGWVSFVMGAGSFQLMKWTNGKTKTGVKFKAVADVKITESPEGEYFYWAKDRGFWRYRWFWKSQERVVSGKVRI